MANQPSRSQRWLSFALLACCPVLLSHAQPQSSAFRITKAITVVNSDLFVYGGASPASGDCFSDFYQLSLDPSHGWAAGSAPWSLATEETTGNDPGGFSLSTNSWIVPSSSGDRLFAYGQTLCSNDRAVNPDAPHTFVTSSGSVLLQKNSGGKWSPGAKTADVLGPRLVKDDNPTPVQAFDPASHTVYTFVYDAFNPQLGVALFSFSSDQPPSNMGQSIKNVTMDLAPKAPETPAPPPPPPPTNGTGNGTEPVPPPPPPPTPAAVPQAAPFVDIGAAVFINGMITVVGGGRPPSYAGLLANQSEDFESTFGYYKMDRCWTYDPAANQWTKRTLTAAGGSFPSPRRLHALLAVDNKIYMHGGNATDTVPDIGYATDLWVLDTGTWAWSKGPSSENGRAYHTLVRYQNTLFAVSGYSRLPTKSSPAQNAFVMIYNLDTNIWSSQYGNISQSFFQQHTALILGCTAAGVIVLIAVAAVVNRFMRRRRHMDRKYDQFDITTTMGRKKTKTMPFLAKSAKPVEPTVTSRAVATGGGASGAAAAAAAGGLAMGAAGNEAINSRSFQNQYGNNRDMDDGVDIDLSAVRSPPGSSTFAGVGFHQQPHHQRYEQQQQQVPLMAADSLDQQDFPTPYHDEPFVDRSTTGNPGPDPHHQLPQRFSQQSFGISNAADHIQIGDFVYGTSAPPSGTALSSTTEPSLAHDQTHPPATSPANNNDLPPI